MRISGSNAKQVVFGTINICTGARLFLVRPPRKSIDFQAFLSLIHDRYRGWHVALLLDLDSSHIAETSQDKADPFGIELLWLPKRSPHLNPMDHLWRHAKATISANRQYATIDESVERFICYLDGLSDYEALRKAGLLSPDFWLHRVYG